MKKIIICITIGLYLGGVASCFSPLLAQEVTRVQVGNNQDYGIRYNLPTKQLHIHVAATCTIVKAGVFAPYAEKYLGLTNVPMEDYSTWTMGEVSMQSETIADSSKVFFVTFNEKMPMPTIYLGAQGQLLSINREPVLSACTQVDPIQEIPVEQQNLHAMNVMNEELLKAGSKSKQAEIAARQIFRIRESRLNLLTGEVDNLPADGASFQLILDNLKAQEAAYMELFTGVTTTTTATRDFDYCPNNEGSGILFRFSKHFGFVAADDLSGEPYLIHLSVLEDKRKVPVLLDGKGKPKPQGSGIAYSVPGKARVSILHKGNVLCKEELLLSNFGHVEYLPAMQFNNKKMPASALIDAETGALELFSTQN